MNASASITHASLVQLDAPDEGTAFESGPERLIHAHLFGARSVDCPTGTQPPIAFCYINVSFMPQRLLACARQHGELDSDAIWVAFDDCPLVGRLDKTGLIIGYTFPNPGVIRDEFIAWLQHYRIPFQVAM